MLRYAMRVMPHRVGASGYPLTPPLRTVRESFPSHGSSLAEDASVRGAPALDEKQCILRTHRKLIRQLGNTCAWPFWAALPWATAPERSITTVRTPFAGPIPR